MTGSSFELILYDGIDLLPQCQTLISKIAEARYSKIVLGWDWQNSAQSILKFNRLLKPRMMEIGSCSGVLLPHQDVHYFHVHDPYFADKIHKRDNLRQQTAAIKLVYKSPTPTLNLLRTH